MAPERTDGKAINIIDPADVAIINKANKPR